MSRYILLLLVLISTHTFGKDTLYFKRGEQKSVRNIEMDTLANLVGYVMEGDSIYASILVKNSPNYRLSQSLNSYIRLHLVDRFGGIKNVPK